MTIYLLLSIIVLLGISNSYTALKLIRTERTRRLLSERVENLSSDIVEYHSRVPYLEQQLSLSKKLLAANEEYRIKKLLPADNNVDKLLESMKQMEVTNIENFSYSKEYDSRFIGTKPLVVLELVGVIKLIDLAQVSEGKEWSVDLLYNGSPFPRLTEDQKERLRDIFMEKMAEAAMRDSETKNKQIDTKICE